MLPARCEIRVTVVNCIFLTLIFFTAMAILIDVRFFTTTAWLIVNYC